MSVAAAYLALDDHLGAYGSDHGPNIYWRTAHARVQPRRVKARVLRVDGLEHFTDGRGAFIEVAAPDQRAVVQIRHLYLSPINVLPLRLFLFDIILVYS